MYFYNIFLKLITNKKLHLQIISDVNFIPPPCGFFISPPSVYSLICIRIIKCIELRYTAPPRTYCAGQLRIHSAYLIQLYLGLGYGFSRLVVSVPVQFWHVSSSDTFVSSVVLIHCASVYVWYTVLLSRSGKLCSCLGLVYCTPVQVWYTMLLSRLVFCASVQVRYTLLLSRSGILYSCLGLVYCISVQV